MATEYRELNAVIKAIWSVKISPDAEIFNALKRAIEEEVKNIEPADVRPVVYCKDCKHSDTFSPDYTEATFPLKCLSVRYGGVFPLCFCEHGERNGGADGVGERLERLEQLEKLLPVRPGDVVYETDGIRVYRHTVRRIVFDCGTFAFDEDAIANGNVFLTEREAEMAAGLFREPEAGTGDSSPTAL